MQHNISLLVGLKNNLEYTQFFYKTTRALYPEVEIIFVSYGSTDGTHQWLDKLEDEHVRYFYSFEVKTLADTYNKCIDLATKEYVIFLHNDIVLTPNFIENIEKNITSDNVIFYTTIEPPIFEGHERPGKIIKDFGSEIKSLRITDLYQFSIERQNTEHRQSKDGICLFMGLAREQVAKTGGLDNLFNPMFCEDDDLILRLKLSGLKIFTELDAICYHFVSKTSRFSDEYKTKTQLIESNSQRNFFRKWTFSNASIIQKKYDIALVVSNCDEKTLQQTEPYCSMIYVDCDFQNYILQEQHNTKFDLSERIKPIQALMPHQVVVRFNAKRFSNHAFHILQNLSSIITKQGAKKETFFTKLYPYHKRVRKNIFHIEIESFDSHENQLIKLFQGHN